MLVADIISTIMKEINYIELLERFLKGEASEAEEATLFCWFGTEAAKKKIYASYDETLNNVSDKLPEDIQNKIYRRIEEDTDLQRVTKKNNFSLPGISRYVAVACVCIFLGVAAVLYWSKSFMNTDFIVSAEEGMKSTVELPDGTMVWLNSGSRLQYSNTYNFWDRTVVLEGEGYFEVKQNQRNKFIVRVNGVEVKALGTKFDVKAYVGDEKIVTTLIEGKVSVKSETEELFLSRDQQLEFDLRSGSFSEIKSCDARRYALWKNNELYFNCEPLDEIGKTLERLYSIDVVFTSEAAKKYTFCGAISNTNLINVLECISLTAPVQYEMKNNILYFSDIEK